MSTLTVETGWIVGTPDSASQLIEKVIGWVRLNTNWTPDESASKDLDNLKREIMMAYDVPGEGYCAFATQIIDGVLNRIYPYLIEFSAKTGTEIKSDRKKALTEDEIPVIEYTLTSKPGEAAQTDEQGNPVPNIEGNPYPKPNEISETPVTPIPGSPLPEYSPVYPGVPYNPFDPLAREINPYPLRSNQPAIPYVPGEPSLPESPITERTTYESPNDGYRELLDSLPRAGEISLEGLPETEENEQNEENEENEENESPPNGEEENEDKIPNELIPLLKRILYEIENQGTETRQALLESVLSILDGMKKQTDTLHSGLTNSEELLGRVIENNAEAERAILKEIQSQLEKAQKEPEETENALLSLLAESLDNVSDWIKSGFNAVRNAIESGLEGVGKSIASIGGILESGFDAVAEAITNSITSLKDSLAAGNKTFTDWLSSAFEFNPDDFSKYLCAFLTEIEKCKECGYLQANKEG